MKFKTAVILCGGKGTRLGSLGKKIPKTLSKVHENLLYGILLNHYPKILLTILFFQLVIKVK